MTAPDEAVCRCNRIIPRPWPAREEPLLCDACRIEQARDKAQLTLALDGIKADHLYVRGSGIDKS